MQFPRRANLVGLLRILFGVGAALSSGNVARVFADEAAPTYTDHQDLTYYLDAKGERHPVKAPADWDVRRKHVLEAMQRVMGPLPGAAKRVPLDVKKVEDTLVGDVLRRKITFQSEPGDRVPAYVLIPTRVAGKMPAVLCLHQTTRVLGKGEPAGLGGKANLHYALELAQRGYVTLAPDYPSFGEHKWDFKHAGDYQSGTMKAIWDNLRAVDVLESLPEVDGERIGCIGHSLGGHNTIFTAAFDPRIKVIVSSCGFTRLDKDDMPSWTGPVYMPRIASVYGNDAKRLPFDFTEIVGALAPRPFFASAAVQDDDFDVSGVRDAMASAEKIYDLYGKRADLVGYYPDCKHDFPPDARKLAYEFLDKHLKKGDGK